MTSYVTPMYYFSDYMGVVLPEDEVSKALKLASMHIDTLTFNRIKKIGYDNLTEHQKDIISEVICMQAEFEYENRDVIDTVLQSYSINGVSMSFGSSWNIQVQNGVAIRKDLYSLLSQTGLCYRGVV